MQTLELEGGDQGLVQPDQGLPRFGSQEQPDFVHVPLLEDILEGVPHS